MLKVRYFIAGDGHSPFADWFGRLDPIAQGEGDDRTCAD
jgi:hypothetical protein